MPIIAEIGRRSPKIRALTIVMYLILALLGVTMAYPFLITLTSSVSNKMDYMRFSPWPRSIFSREDRFVRGLVPYFNNVRGSMEQLAFLFKDVPPAWTTWLTVGKDRADIDKFARGYLAMAEDPARWEQVQRMAADYDEFAGDYPISDSICDLDEQHMGAYLRKLYHDEARAQSAARGERLARRAVERKALALISRRWEIPLSSFYTMRAYREFVIPWDQPNYCPPTDGQSVDFERLRQGYRERQFVPPSIFAKWRAMLKKDESVRSFLKLPGSAPVTLAELNAALGTNYQSFRAIPAPVTAQHPPLLRALWGKFTGEFIPACQTRPFPLKTAWIKYLGAQTTRATGSFGSDAPGDTTSTGLTIMRKRLPRSISDALTA